MNETVSLTVRPDRERKPALEHTEQHGATAVFDDAGISFGASARAVGCNLITVYSEENFMKY